LLPAATIRRRAEKAKIKLATFKKQIEDEVTKGAGRSAASADNLRARKGPRQADRGLLRRHRWQRIHLSIQGSGWEPRLLPPRRAPMVDAFAQTAFALKPYQMSDVVQTQLATT